MLAWFVFCFFLSISSIKSYHHNPLTHLETSQIMGSWTARLFRSGRTRDFQPLRLLRLVRALTLAMLATDTASTVARLDPDRGAAPARSAGAQCLAPDAAGHSADVWPGLHGSRPPRWQPTRHRLWPGLRLIEVRHQLTVQRLSALHLVQWSRC